MKQLSEWGSFYWVVPVVVVSIVAVIYVERRTWRKKALWTILVIWFAALIYLMFIYRLPSGQRKITMDLFHMYREAVRYSGPIATNQVLRQIFFNILLYVPFGMIVGSLTRKVWLSVILGIGLSVLTEALQYWTSFGWADVDDVISNVIGVVLGIIVCVITKRKSMIIDN